MEERYKKMAKLGVRNIDGYNQRLVEARGKGEDLTRTVHTGFDKESGKAIYEEEKLDLDPLPYIVIIVDEMADLMMVAGKDIEGAVQRLAQMARAAGLHVILATQRPSVDVITGTIKANFPTRISFRSLRRSTAAPSSAKWAPSNCSDRATCSIWPAADASAACMVRSFPTRKSRRWCVISRRRGSRSIWKPSRRKSRPTKTARCSIPPGWAAMAAATCSLRLSRSSSATARPRRPTFNAVCKSAITAPPH